MPYQVIVNGSSLFEGNTSAFFLAVFIILVILATVILTIWRKLRYNEGLKYEFITIIAHKFRTPLTHLKWLAEGLLADEQDAAKKQNLTDLQQSTDHLINLTGTLIELTNADNETRATYQFEQISLSDLVRGVGAAFKNLFHEKNLLFSVQTPPTDISASVDRTRMEFVLQTILENSYIYTPPGRKAGLFLSAEKGKAVITVSDNGIGIAPTDIPHLFTKFYRAANARSTDTEGFGVGLYLAQSIVKRHGGKIEVYSEGHDKGATFRIILPLKK